MPNLPMNGKVLALLATAIFIASLFLQNAYGVGDTAVRHVAIVISNVGYFVFAVLGGVTVVSVGTKWLKDRRTKQRGN